MTNTEIAVISADGGASISFKAPPDLRAEKVFMTQNGVYKVKTVGTLDSFNGTFGGTDPGTFRTTIGAGAKLTGSGNSSKACGFIVSRPSNLLGKLIFDIR
jgi:hypothetical protein